LGGLEVERLERLDRLITACDDRQCGGRESRRLADGGRRRPGQRIRIAGGLSGGPTSSMASLSVLVMGPKASVVGLGIGDLALAQ
jgi:hypothetical protein